jgi:hypothetical protein
VQGITLKVLPPFLRASAHHGNTFRHRPLREAMGQVGDERKRAYTDEERDPLSASTICCPSLCHLMPCLREHSEERLESIVSAIFVKKIKDPSRRSLVQSAKSLTNERLTEPAG